MSRRTDVASDRGERISYAERLRRRAAAEPTRTALLLVDSDGSETPVSLAELAGATERAAHALRRAGVDGNSVVMVELPTSVAHFAATLGAWRLGACVVPLSPALPEPEWRQIVDVARGWRPTVVVTERTVEAVRRVDPLDLEAPADGEPLADVVPVPGKAICSGGSTGRPKIIVDPNPWQAVVGDFGTISPTGVGVDEVQLVTGRLYHNTAFMLAHRGLFNGHLLVVMQKFDAVLATDLIERHGVTFMGCVPTVLQRIAKLPGVFDRDFSSLRALYYTGGAAPDWMRETWARLVPPECQFDMYGAAEGVGQCVLRGDEWPAHRGTVGRPYDTAIRILDEQQRELPRGTAGDIYLRRLDLDQPPFFYIGSPPPRQTPDGYTSVGDIGFLDDDGYLHLLDRRVDMIVSGGANVYCAEVEQALTGHPDVLDAAVIGLPDDEWGHRVHAIVELRPGGPQLPVEELSRYVRQRLAAYKAPKTYEYVPALARDESGQLRRSLMVAERSGSATQVKSTEHV